MNSGKNTHNHSGQVKGEHLHISCTMRCTTIFIFTTACRIQGNRLRYLLKELFCPQLKRAFTKEPWSHGTEGSRTWNRFTSVHPRFQNLQAYGMFGFNQPRHQPQDDHPPQRRLLVTTIRLAQIIASSPRQGPASLPSTKGRRRPGRPGKRRMPCPRR